VTGGSLDRQIDAVVAAGNCSGCGACCLLDGGLGMELNEHGYNRPVRHTPPSAGSVRARFDKICPGLVVRAQRPKSSARHALLGSTFRAWKAWATDPQIRHLGSSGGTITALVSWLLENGRISSATEAAGDPRAPLRTTTTEVSTAAGALESAGSRYAPVSNAAHAVLGRPDVAFVGKPCEVAAVRALAGESGRCAPLLISFFCAGTPSQTATDQLASRLADASEVTDLWYRGHGWPGRFTVTMSDGSTTSDDYDHSWGKVLGPTIQWRCKICPDGIGESADIVAADIWETDSRGFPVFDERPGVSALLARTERGLEVLEEAFAADVLAGGPLHLDALAAAQPSQVERRQTLLARALGARLAGRQVPRFRGFALPLITRGRPRVLARIARGSYRRVREGRADG
jgi:coenzyme F420 hydrogenase subunit beta